VENIIGGTMHPTNLLLKLGKSLSNHLIKKALTKKS
jgi:hypothetical protein